MADKLKTIKSALPALVAGSATFGFAAVGSVTHDPAISGACVVAGACYASLLIKGVMAASNDPSLATGEVKKGDRGNVGR